MKTSWIVMGALSMSLAGCGGGGSGAGGGTDTDTGTTGDTDGSSGLDEARSRLEPVVRASCEWLFRCCSGGETRVGLGPFVTDAEDCTQRALDSLEAGNKSPGEALDVGPASTLLFLASSLDLERISLNQEALDACVAWLDARACNEVPSAELPDHCTPGENEPEENPCLAEDLFDGLQVEGGSCNATLDLECGDDMRCVSFGADGVCAKLSGADETCFLDSECADPLICDYLTGTCRAGAKKGEVCTYSDPENPDPGTEKERCESGLTCNPETMSCTESSCSPGALCVVDWQCPEDYVCVLNRCRMPVGLGEECQQDGDCASDECDPILDVCVPKIATGDPCSADSECQTGFCDLGVCGPTVAAGGACPSGDDAECEDGWCDDFTDPLMPVCTAFKGAGQSCMFALECDPDPDLGLTCWEMECRSLPFPDGVSCSVGSQCESTVCWMGVCEAGTAAGEACAIDGTVKACAQGLFCKIDDDVMGTGLCQSILSTGEICETDQECWGGCDVSYGELLCDDTPAPETAWCDGA